MKPILLTIFLVFFSLNDSMSQTLRKIPMNEIVLGKDSVRFPLIHELIDNDSAQILEFNKIRYEGMSVVDERLVYIDYRLNTPFKKELKDYLTHYEDSKNRGWLYSLDDPDLQIKKSNPFPELETMYLPVSILKGELVLFEPEAIYGTVLTDTTVLRKGMEGWLSTTFSNINLDEGIYTFVLNRSSNRVDSLELKPIKKGNAQIWRMTSFTKEGEPVYRYNLMSAIDFATSLPVLRIINTGGIDGVYSRFDKVDLEAMFEE